MTRYSFALFLTLILLLNLAAGIIGYGLGKYSQPISVNFTPEISFSLEATVNQTETEETW